MSQAEFNGCQSDGRYYDKSTVRNDHPGCEGSQMRFQALHVANLEA